MNANSYDSPSTLGGNREDLRNVLTILEPEDTPFTSMVNKPGAPKATFIEVLADTLRPPRLNGSREGTDAGKGGNKATKRARFGSYVHRLMDEFAVTDVQQIVSKGGGTAAISDEYENAKAKCIRELKRDIEAFNCSDGEMNGGNDLDMTTRGAFKWLDSSAQTVQPVPSDFRPPAGNILSGVGTSVPLFTEAQFNGILKSLQRVYGGPRTYTVIAGDSVVETIDNFTRVNSSSSNTRYVVNENATAHEISLMVQVFASSFGRANIVPTQFNKCTAAGVGDPTAALIINPDLWEMNILDPLHAADLPEEGGGPAGYVKTMWALNCRNPKGNAKIYNT